MEIVIELNLPSEYETRIYVSSLGNICIRQQESINSRLPVVLSIKQAKLLLQSLPEMLAEAEDVISLSEADDEQES